jgi:hypothetical protein
MQFSPLPCYTLPPRPKHSPQHRLPLTLSICAPLEEFSNLSQLLCTLLLKILKLRSSPKLSTANQRGHMKSVKTRLNYKAYVLLYTLHSLHNNYSYTRIWTHAHCTTLQRKAGVLASCFEFGKSQVRFLASWPAVLSGIALKVTHDHLFPQINIHNHPPFSAVECNQEWLCCRGPAVIYLTRIN